MTYTASAQKLRFWTGTNYLRIIVFIKQVKQVKREAVMSLWQKHFFTGLLVISLLFVAEVFATEHGKRLSGMAYSAVMVDASRYQIKHPAGSMAAGFWAGAASATYRQAAVAWMAFLKAHEPANGEFEDGMHARYVKIAKIELARIYYLQHQLHKADVLMKSAIGDF